MMTIRVKDSHLIKKKSGNGDNYKGKNYAPNNNRDRERDRGANDQQAGGKSKFQVVYAEKGSERPDSQQQNKKYQQQSQPQSQPQTQAKNQPQNEPPQKGARKGSGAKSNIFNNLVDEESS